MSIDHIRPPSYDVLTVVDFRQVEVSLVEVSLVEVSLVEVSLVEVCVGGMVVVYCFVNTYLDILRSVDNSYFD